MKKRCLIEKFIGFVFGRNFENVLDFFFKCFMRFRCESELVFGIL